MERSFACARIEHSFRIAFARMRKREATIAYYLLQSAIIADQGGRLQPRLDGGAGPEGPDLAPEGHGSLPCTELPARVAARTL
jgi:hypothetical protein